MSSLPTIRTSTAFLLGLMFLSSAGFSQEICDNGIDDDNDGLIDLNDTTDCSCNLFTLTPNSLIPNPSFEDTLCCPTANSELDCAESWVQASTATSDYFNFCGYSYLYAPPNIPLPGNGSGFAGFIADSSWNEYVGACLNGPMLAGTSYTLNFYTALSQGSSTLDLSIFGTTDCGDLPWTGTTCPLGVGNWMELDSMVVSYGPAGEWQLVSMTFTPTVDINAIAIGASCDFSGTQGVNYYYIDELILDSTFNFGAWVTANDGNICENELILTASTIETGGTWQWYLEGIALVGETNSTLDVLNYGTGNFTAVYTTPNGCIKASASTFQPVYPVADFSVTTDICSGTANFFDQSTITGGSVDTVIWSFGDTIFDASENFTTPGTYEITQVVISNYGCRDTTSQFISFEFNLTADFNTTINVGTFPANPGDTLNFCDPELLDLQDMSTVTSPNTIVSYQWDFGDLNGSMSQDTSYLHTEAGFYIVELTVEADNGCTNSIYQPILIYENPIANFQVISGTNAYQSLYTDTIDVCINATISFMNISSVPYPDSVGFFHWNFGDGTFNNGENNELAYSTPGVYTVALNFFTAHGCLDQDSIVIIAHDVGAQVISTIDATCQGTNDGGATIGNISGIQGVYTVNWFNDTGALHATNIIPYNSTSSQDNLTTGIWHVTVENIYGCLWDTSFNINSVLPPVNISTNLGHPQCYGTANGSITAFSSNGGDLEFEITSVATNQQVNIPNTNTANTLPSGAYSISIVDSLGCYNEIIVHLIDPPPIDIHLDITHPLCFGFETAIVNVDTIFNAQGNYNAIYYGWDPNPNGLNGLLETSNIGLTAGEYILEVADDSGCTNSIVFRIIDPNPLIGVLEVASPTYCRTAGFQKGNGEVTVTTAGLNASGTGNVEYLWRNLENGEESDETTFIVNEPGWMEATITDANGCIFKERIYVDSLNPQAYFTPISQQFHGPGEFEGTEDLTVEFINESQNFSKPTYELSDTIFSWNLDAGLNEAESDNWFFSFDYNEKIDTMYQGEKEYLVCLVAKNFNNCRDTFCRVIEVHDYPELDVPNVFTPGRMPNEAFYFPSEGIETFECNVFNRYGIEVFHFNSIEDQWDGLNFKTGVPCVEGVYFFTYRAKSTNRTLFEGQGNIHLIRQK